MTTQPTPDNDQPMRTGTRVIGPDGRLGTVIERNTATADHYERVRLDATLLVVRYPRTHLRVASPADTGFNDETGTAEGPGPAFFAVIIGICLFAGVAVVTYVLNPPLRPEFRCQVVMPGVNDQPEQASDAMNLLIEQVSKVEFTPNYRFDDDRPTVGIWTYQEDSMRPDDWKVLGYSAQEDSTIYDRPDCVPA